MARIRIPTPFNELMKNVSHQEFIPLLSKYKATDLDGNYLHWNKFK
jgi:hypothetical protein